MKISKSFLTGGGIIIIFLAIYFVNLLFVTPSRTAKVVYFTVAKGEGMKEISTHLATQGLIKYQLAFQLYVGLSGQRKKLMAGEHKLSPDMNIIEVAGALARGNTVAKEKAITIIEGWRAEEIGAYLESQRLVQKTEFLQAIKIANWREQYRFLKEVRAETLEGFLFPDTYRVFLNATAADIVRKMLDNFDNKITATMRSDLAKKNHSLLEIVTMASIIEREGRTDTDRKMIADIFWKRIDLGMPLQSDATINYLTGKSALRPSTDDLTTDSPYNTYKYRGLPPGPINNPGLSSINAAIYPKKNDYYFFLTAKDGKTIFSKTFTEHQKNIEKYLN